MKRLRNKKTGEKYETTTPIVFNIKTSGGGEHTVSCESIAELNEKWEDAPEEPKEYWYIDTTEGVVVEHTREMFELTDKERQQIGNYFETQEEAEKAVERLRAWKRLKDKGFRFAGVGDVERTIRFEIPFRAGHDSCEAEADLDELFGGEE